MEDLDCNQLHPLVCTNNTWHQMGLLVVTAALGIGLAGCYAPANYAQRDPNIDKLPLSIPCSSPIYSAASSQQAPAQVTLVQAAATSPPVQNFPSGYVSMPGNSPYRQIPEPGMKNQPTTISLLPDVLPDPKTIGEKIEKNAKVDNSHRFESPTLPNPSPVGIDGILLPEISTARFDKAQEQGPRWLGDRNLARPGQNEATPADR